MKKYLISIMVIVIFIGGCSNINLSKEQDPTTIFRSDIQKENKRYGLELKKENKRYGLELKKYNTSYTGSKMILSISIDELKSKDTLYKVKEQIVAMKGLELTHTSNVANIYKKYKQTIQFILAETMDEGTDIQKNESKIVNEKINSLQKIIDLMNKHYSNEENFLDQNIIIADILIQNHNKLKFIGGLPSIEGSTNQKEFYIAYKLYMTYYEQYNKSREEIRNLITDSLN